MLGCQRFFAANGAALRCIQQALQDASEVRIATAYFEASGYQLLQDTLRGKKVRLLIGRPEGGENRAREMLEEFMRELSYGIQDGRTQAMRQLLEALEQGWITVAVGAAGIEQAAWLEARYLYHHAKLYIADRRRAVVTSANFSYHGLLLSREAGYVVTEPEDVAFFVEHFDEYFQQATSITKELIEALQAWLREYDPYFVYARALLELYGLPEENAPSKLPPLAEYQKGVVSSVLRSLLEHNGAFLIASTGLGKTIIAAHVAAYLRMRNEIQTAIVICPAGMRETWRRWMRSAHLSSAEFSYHTLATREKERDSKLPILEHELRGVNEETLIILDESHHLRNEDTMDGDLRLSNERIRRAIRENKGRVLLLTATPYGKSMDEVNNQLSLLPPPRSVSTELGLEIEASEWHVHNLKDLADLPPCTVLNTPDVVRHFGERDENGEYFVRFGEEKRYFPRRIRLETVRYENPFDDFFAELLESKLLYKATDSSKHPKHRRQRAQTQKLFELPVPEGERFPLQEALFLHQFCSSPEEVWDVLQKMKHGKYSYRFARQTELAAFIAKHEKKLQELRNPNRDPKLEKLVQIVQRAGQEKVVVFCEYHNTARYVTEGLRKLLPNLKIETAIEQSTADLDNILRRFAPIANEVLEEDRKPEEEIQVLVASRAISEGYNLQDASILVNYDLPWTVLQLAQRMGRILRPWKEPRNITIYNFVPSTMDHERIRHARNWQERLKERSAQHRSLAQIPVLVHEESKRENLAREFEMEKLGRELYLAKEISTDLDLDKAMELVNQLTELDTSAFYKDLAEIRNPDEIRRLPAGIRSAMKHNGPKQLFLLLKQGRNIYTVVADSHGNPLEKSYRRDEIMRLIRCVPNTPKAPIDEFPSPAKFDAWIERSRERWAEKLDISPQRFQILCALALV